MNNIIVLIIIGVLIWKIGFDTFLLIILGLAIVLVTISISSFFFDSEKKETIDKKKRISTIKYDLLSAITNLDVTYVKKLIENGENINKKDNHGNTPLINAVILRNVSDELKRQKQDEIIELLLKRNADVYTKNNYGYNILEIMANKSHYDEIRKIFEKYDYFKNTKNENDRYLTSLKESTIKEIDLSSNIDNLKNKLKSNQINENLLIGTKKINDNKLNIEENNINLTNNENEKYSSFIDNKEELKSTIELQFKTIKKLEEDLRLQSKEIDNLKKDSKDKESKQAQQLNELVSKIEKFDKIEVQSKIIKNLEEHLRSQSNEINKIKKYYKQEQIVYQNELLKRIENSDDMEIQLKNIKNLDNQLLSQSKEIYNIKKEFLDKEIKQTLYINELVQKIERLEELLKNKPSNKSEKRPLDIPIQLEKQTINKTDGELIKRDSFDDF
jgi:ankyrin repeat protein